MSDDSFENVADEVGGLAEGASKVRRWAVEQDAGDGALIATADLLVDSAQTLDAGRGRKGMDMRALATLYRQHREILAQLMERVPEEEPANEFTEFLEDLRS